MTGKSQQSKIQRKARVFYFLCGGAGLGRCLGANKLGAAGGERLSRVAKGAEQQQDEAEARESHALKSCRRGFLTRWKWRRVRLASVR
jgi:hypothetical protein